MTAISLVILAVSALALVDKVCGYPDNSRQNLLNASEFVFNVDGHREKRDVDCSKEPRKFWKAFKCCKEMPHLAQKCGGKGKGKWKGDKQRGGKGPSDGGGPPREGPAAGGPPAGGPPAGGPPAGGPPDGGPPGAKGPRGKGRGHGPRGRFGPPECGEEKRFEKHNWVSNGTLQIEEIQKYVSEKYLSKDGSPWSEITKTAIDKCSASAVEEANNSNSTCKSGAFQFRLCYHTELLKNCPEKNLKTNKKCSETLEYVRNCPAPKPPQGPPPEGSEPGSPPEGPPPEGPPPEGSPPEGPPPEEGPEEFETTDTAEVETTA